MTTTTTHNALPAEGAPAVEAKPERPAAATWVKGESGAWLLKVRESMHRPGRAAKVTSRMYGTSKLLILGEIADYGNGGFVLSDFTDPNPKPPRPAKAPRKAKEPVRRNAEGQILASTKQTNYVMTLWERNGGGKFVTTDSHTLERPDFNALTKSEASWYIDVLTEDAF